MHLRGCLIFLSEIRTLKWCEVCTDTLDLAMSKTGPRKVYLNSEARRIIERQPRTGSDHVFPSPSDPALARIAVHATLVHPAQAGRHRGCASP